MSRLGKVDPKFFTEEDLEAVKSGVAKWKAVCDETHVGDITECEACNITWKRYGHGRGNCPLCVLGDTHGDGGEGEYGCISHYDGAASWARPSIDPDDIKPSKRDARALLTHLRNIQRQIERGLECASRPSKR